MLKEGLIGVVGVVFAAARGLRFPARAGRHQDPVGTTLATVSTAIGLPVTRS